MFMMESPVVLLLLLYSWCWVLLAMSMGPSGQKHLELSSFSSVIGIGGVEQFCAILFSSAVLFISRSSVFFSLLSQVLRTTFNRPWTIGRSGDA